MTRTNREVYQVFCPSGSLHAHTHKQTRLAQLIDALNNAIRTHGMENVTASSPSKGSLIAITRRADCDDIMGRLCQKAPNYENQDGLRMTEPDFFKGCEHTLYTVVTPPGCATRDIYPETRSTLPTSSGTVSTIGQIRRSREQRR